MGAATLREAVRASAQGRDDRMAADTALALAYHVGTGLGRSSEALEALTAVDAMIARAGSDPVMEADALTVRALFLNRLDRSGEGRACVERAVKLRQEALGSEHPDLGLSLNILGVIERSEGNYAKARECFGRAGRIWSASLGPDHDLNAWAELNLGTVLALEERCDEALPHFERSLEVCETQLGPDHPRVTYALVAMGSCLVELGRPADALPHLERAFAPDRAHPPRPDVLAQGRFALARALAATGGDAERALALAREARTGYASLGPREAVSLTRVEAWLAARGQGSTE